MVASKVGLPTPDVGDEVTMEYYSSQGAAEQTLTGEVVASTPTPDGWWMEVATYSGDRRKVVVDGDTAVVKALKTSGQGQWTRIGLAEVGDDPQISIR